MIPTAEFLQLSTRAQREIIFDGITYLKIESRKFSTTMDKLNQWLAAMDTVDVDSEFIIRFLDATKELSGNIDTLTEKIVQNAERVNGVSEIFHQQRLKERLNKTPL